MKLSAEEESDGGAALDALDGRRAVESLAFGFGGQEIESDEIKEEFFAALFVEFGGAELVGALLKGVLEVGFGDEATSDLGKKVFGTKAFGEIGGGLARGEKESKKKEKRAGHSDLGKGKEAQPSRSLASRIRAWRAS